MKKKFTIIGILCTMVLSFLIPHTGLSQNTSTTSDTSKNYCFNETQYRGILRLYTYYESCLDIKVDLEYRMYLKDSAYNQCSAMLVKTNEQLGITNNMLKDEIGKNMWYDTELQRIKRQRNYIVVGGLCLTGSLLLFIFAQ